MMLAILYLEWRCSRQTETPQAMLEAFFYKLNFSLT